MRTSLNRERYMRNTSVPSFFFSVFIGLNRNAGVCKTLAPRLKGESHDQL